MMAGTPASDIVLSEVEVERSLLGSLFAAPDAFADVAPEIDPNWFSDPLAKYMFVECTKLQQEGHTLSTPVIMSMLPEDCGGLPRGAFYANTRLAGQPVTQIGALIATLKDRWARRSLLAAAEGLKQSAAMFGYDPFELAGDAVLALDTISAAKAVKASGTMETAANSLLASLGRPEALRGATTGLRALDKKLNGYKAGQLYVIAGRPGMGKSAFMCSSLRATAAAGYGVAIFSLEMGEEEIAARCIADSMGSVSAPGFGDLLKGQIEDEWRERIGSAAEHLSGLPLHIDASPRLTFSEITGRARKLKARLEAEGRFLSVLCIDHMGLVTPSDRYRGNKVAEAGEVSGLARSLAKELDCCVILLCQLSREVEKRDDKRPIMADLRWSGEIEQDAHVVAFLYRDYYYRALDPTALPGDLQSVKHNLDFLIRKNRNGETGDIGLYCSIAHSSVRDE